MCGFGIFDQADDPGERGVIAGAFCAHVQGTGLQDRAGEHHRVLCFVFRGRFAGDRGFVDCAVAADDNPGHRQLLAGANQDHVTEADRVDINESFLVDVVEAGRLGHGADQSF